MNFIIKLCTKVLLIVTILCIISTVSCKKESELSIQTDTTFTSLSGNQKTAKFDFLISVTVYNSVTKNFELVSANLKIDYDTYEFSGILEPNINLITLRETATIYNIEVSKDGYNTFSTEMQLSDIKNWSDKPLVVVLN